MVSWVKIISESTPDFKFSANASIDCFKKPSQKSGGSNIRESRKKRKGVKMNFFTTLASSSFTMIFTFVVERYLRSTLSRPHVGCRLLPRLQRSNGFVRNIFFCS
jgi:hypothetical protein